MRLLLYVASLLPAVAVAHPGHGESNSFHWHGAELLLVVLALIGLAWFFGRR